MAGLSAVVLDAQQLAAPGHAVGADAALALIDFHQPVELMEVME